ncbi:MAG: heavy-metal-associated domain-containing protein [Bacteroidota bacterium]|nr:heavy-metal-associated domain-containing protein [Bacteroidota bacterium]MDP4230902.1 heavy-metal-associated domain-containing protein [Bacteroidota bacterium]MDP4237702.1 heavy-metal-associated domain-containing protein [Bacteroidota bacterium]
MESVKLQITGMHCLGCVRTVTNALKRVDGVADVDVSLQSRSATVRFEASQTSIRELSKAIQDAGYEVSEVD